MEWKKLTDISRPTQWKTVSMKDLKDEGYPVYGANGIIGYYDEYTHSNPTLMITCRGATCGNINMSFGKAYINGNAMAIDHLDNGVNIRYLYYFLSSYDFRKVISGSAQPQITRANLKNILIPVPSLKEQQEIVVILDRAQVLIDKRNEQLEMLDDLIKSVFYDMFGDPVKNEKGWETRDLGSVLEVNPKKSEISELKDEKLEVSFIPMENVGEDGNLNLKETKSIEEVYKSYTYFKENDILFAKITPCMENGKSCIAKNLINGIGFGSSEFHVIRCNERIRYEYVFQLIRTKIFKKLAEARMTGSAGQRRVPKTFIEDFPLPLPPLSLQESFAAEVVAIEHEKAKLEASRALLEENYRALMDRAFKGDLI